ncbi:hypothetical protein GUJ93_ZPchr0007g4287 [Zizania palustris]|uniref:Uncharacterized protein n=1 Tax=Zizania palustris TaxID=103762 RepID=A0A8J5TAX6_ZIZPA|nr:hypothetical protein GUJ93_ZPchr0007g4287 [Zizania palustris]
MEARQSELCWDICFSKLHLDCPYWTHDSSETLDTIILDPFKHCLHDGGIRKNRVNSLKLRKLCLTKSDSVVSTCARFRRACLFCFPHTC